jgi:hypothetical protein
MLEAILASIMNIDGSGSFDGTGSAEGEASGSAEG